MNFDDLPDDEPTGSTPQSNAPAQSAQAPLRFDDIEHQAQPSFDDMPDEQPKYSPLETAAAHAAKSAVPTTAGLATGLAVGAATSPFITPIGGAVAGVAAGVGVGLLSDKAQDWVLDKLGIGKGINETLGAMEQQNPISAAVGQFAPAALSLKPSGSMVQRGIGALIGGGATLAEQAATGEFDPTKLAVNTIGGAALPNANKLGEKFLGVGENVGQRLAARYKAKTAPGAEQEPSGPPGRPDQKSKDEGGTSPGAEEPDIEVANDVTTTARGVAAENPPAPEIVGAGNPEGAPMAAREAARPSDPERDYRKESTGAAKEGIRTSDSTPISTADLHEDLAMALKPDTTGLEEVAKPAQQPETTPDVRAPQEAAPEQQPPVETGIPQEQPKPFNFETEPPNKRGEQEIVVKDAQGNRVLEGAVRLDGNTLHILDIYTPFTTPGKVQGANTVGPAKLNAIFNELRSQFPQVTKIAGNRVTGARAFQQSVKELKPYEGGKITRDISPQPAEVTAPVTANELRTTAEVRKLLADAGHNEVLARLDALSPKEQAVAASKLRAALASESGEAVGRETGEVRKETPRPKLKTGVQARSKGDAARKQATLDAVMGIHDEYGPAGDKGKLIDPAAMDKKDLMAWAKEVLAEATKRNGGRDPLIRNKDNYVPVNKGPHTDAYQWLRAVKSLSRGQELKNFQSLHIPEGEQVEVAPKTETAAEPVEAKTEGETKPSVNELDRETQNIEADIQKRPALPEAAAESQLAKTAQSTVGREELEMLPPMKNSKGEVGQDQTYVEQQNGLRKWLNDLSDQDYARVQAANEEKLTSLVNESNDPKDLHSQFLQDLASTTRKRPGVVEHAAEDVPGKVTRLKIPSVKFEPTEPGAAASKGKSLKESDPERYKQLAAEAAARYGVAKPKLSVDERIAAEKKAMKNPENLDKTPPDEAPVSGAWDDFTKNFKEFAGNEEGALTLPKWMVPNSNNPASPAPNPAIKEYSESLGNLFTDYLNRIRLGRMDLHANVVAATKSFVDQKFKPKDMDLLGQAAQNRGLKSLPQNMQDYYTKYVEPVKRTYNQVYDELRALDQTHKFGLDLPDRTIQGPAKDFQPRQQVGKQMYDKTTDDAFDPLTGRTLSAHQPATMEREWNGLQNSKGDRLTFKVAEDANGDKTFSVVRNGRAQELKNIPPGFTGAVGEKIPLKVGGVQDTWTVDHATNKEISRATKGKLEFHENPVMAWTQATESLSKALADAKLMVKVKEDPRLDKNSTTSKEEAREKGYDLNPPQMKAFGQRNGKDVYYPRALRTALDDFFKEGIGNPDLDWGRSMAQNLLKSFYTVTPFIHPLNELDLAIVDRGFKWAQPSAYPTLWKSMKQAYTAVNEMNHHYRNMMEHGGNPMYANTVIRDYLPKAAKAFGMDIQNNPSKWDPIAKLWGVTTPELADAAYGKSMGATWRLSDYIYMTRYFEQLEGGASIPKAVDDAGKFVSTYRTPTHIMTQGKFGRAMAVALKDPLLTAFGRYKYGVFKTYSNMTRDLVHGTSEERKKAVGQLMAAAVLGTVLYPALDKAVQAISGNEDAEFGRHGFSTIPTAVGRYVTGNGPLPTKQVWNPSIPMSMIMEASGNKDFTGKPIVPEGAGFGESAARAAEWAARGAIPPYGTASRGLDNAESAMGTVGGALGEQLGVKLPSEGAQKFNAHKEQRFNREYKQRVKGKSGVIPETYYKVTGQ